MLIHPGDWQLQQYVDGELKENIEQIEQHLQHCRKCALIVKQYKSVYGALGELQQSCIPPGFANRVLQKLDYKQSKQKLGWELPCILIFLLTLVCGFLYYFNIFRYLNIFKQIDLAGISGFLSRTISLINIDYKYFLLIGVIVLLFELFDRIFIKKKYLKFLNFIISC